MKTRIAAATLAAAIVAGLSGAATAQDAAIVEACRAVYLGSTVDITVDQRRLAEYDEIHDAMCQDKSVRKDFNLSSGLKMVFEAIPIEGFLNIGNSSDKREHFCSNFDGLRASVAQSSLYEKNVVVDALSTYNACLQLAASGVTIQPTITMPSQLVVQVGVKDNDTIGLSSVTATSNLRCESPQLDRLVGGKELHKGEAYTFTRDFAIQCERSSKTSELGTHYDRASLTITTTRSDTPIAFTMPEDDMLRPQLASEANTKISDLSRQVGALAEQLETASARVTELSALTERMRLQTYGVLVLRSEGNWMRLPEALNYHFMGCAVDTTDPWFRAPCAAGYSPAQMSDVAPAWSGGACGNAVRILTCVRN